MADEATNKPGWSAHEVSEPDLDELAEVARSEGGLDEVDDDAEIIEAYCVACRHMVEMLNPEPVWTSKGTPGTRGTCPDCGSTVFRMGRTPAHDALVRPHAVRVESGIKTAISGRKRAQPATYINYTAADAVFAEKLAADLKSAGIHTWIDTEDPSPDGVRWAGGVHPALRDSARMVVVLSRAALSDQDFASAWAFFKGQKKPITVVTLDDAPVPDTLRRSPRFAFGGEANEQRRAFRQLVSALSG